MITEKKINSLAKYKYKYNSLPNIYKQLVVNNKINLINNTYNIFNMNSLRFIMIKLGIIYKEFYLIEKGMESLQGFDLKTAHLLMQYIVETSDLQYVVDNRNDSFFIYAIRTAINYLIKLFKKRIDILKSNKNFKSEFLTNTNFLNYFENFKEFKELIIISKYLDILRKLDNDIYYKRRICSESLSLQINSLSVNIQDKNFELKDINYFKNQLYKGKVSDAQNYIMNQILKKIDNGNIHLYVLKRMIVELYSYKILQEEEKLYSICITILRNVSYNPNLFFKNIAMKTQIRSLRNFLLAHLKHSQFTSEKDEEYFNLIKYIDKNYSNPSFDVEYKLKSSKILMSREFKKMKIDSIMFNKNYKQITTGKGQSLEYQCISQNYHVKKGSVELGGTARKFYSMDMLKKKSELFENGPLLTYQNLKIIYEILQNRNIINSYRSHDSVFMEIYDNFFSNSEIDDFGMNKKDYQRPPRFLGSYLFNILSHLIHNYFSEHDEKIYLINQNEKEKDKKSYDCFVCKKTCPSDVIFHIEHSKQHLGYSNISIENLKYFDISHINRIKFDDFLQEETNIENILLYLRVFCEDIPQIKSIFHYIKGHYQTNLLSIFIQNLINSNFFTKIFIDDMKIHTEYFNKTSQNFSFIKDEMLEVFSIEDIENSFFREIMFRNFISKGILIDKSNKVSDKTLRKLILNNLLRVQENTYNSYNAIIQSKTGDMMKKIINLINEKKYEMKKQMKRLSDVDERMDKLILYAENNYYLLQIFLDFNWFNPKFIFSEHHQSLNTWQRMIFLSKYSTTENIFEISLENLKILGNGLLVQSEDIEEDEEETKRKVLILSGCLIYLKQTNFDLPYFFSKLSGGKKLIKLWEGESLRLLESIIPMHGQDTKASPDFNEQQICKDKHCQENFTTKELFTNNIFTCNKDISIKCLINNFYKFLNYKNIADWINRGENYSIILDDFEILIENGRVIEAYYYYIKILKSKCKINEIRTWLYHICFNNLLNYNVFSTAVTFLHLINDDSTHDDDKTKELIVQVEAANRIIIHELNELASKSDDKNPVTKEDMINFVKKKNKNTLEKKYFEINSHEDHLNNQFKQVISIYKKLVSEFLEFKENSNITSSNTTNENLIIQNQNENLIFQILKRLEDATCGGGEDSLLHANEITLESPWHLVSLFCKIHNYEMSLTALHQLGRKNNWIFFLYKAQDQECSPSTVLKILEGYFSDFQLKRHLNIIIQSLINGENQQNEQFFQEIHQQEKEKYNISGITHGFSANFSKVEINRTSFNEFIIYNIKQKSVKAPLTQTLSGQIFDPIYFLTIPEPSKEKWSKSLYILNEALNINWKDLILVSLIFSNFEQETILTSFTLYLYMSVKEILITKSKPEDFVKDNIDAKLLRNLKDIFDNRRKSLRLSELETLIKFLLLNNHPQVLLEVLVLFDMPFSFDEFVLFCKSLFENDYETAFIHLFIFKNSLFDYFNGRFSNNFTGKIWEEEGNVNSVSFDFITSEVKNVESLILVFFYQVSNSIIINLIEFYENDRFKLYKLLEILYMTMWSKRYSNYFKNMCVLNCIKTKRSKQHLNYKSSFEKIVELLILENHFSILSEYILSYEENKEDDTLLYYIFSTIAAFDKNYILYNDEERNQFWEVLEKLMKGAHFSNVEIAKFFLYIIEIKEEKLYLREQLNLIWKIYGYFVSGIKNSLDLKESDKLTKFMRNVIGYDINKSINEEELIEDLKNRIFIIIFSNCQFQSLKQIFINSNCFQIQYILQAFPVIIKELREESPAIKFDKNHWKKVHGTTKAEKSDLLPTTITTCNPMKLQNFNESVKRTCLNLINLNQLNMSLLLSKFYNSPVEELERFDQFMKFLLEKFHEIKKMPYVELKKIYTKACNKSLEATPQLVKLVAYDIKEKLILHLNNCLTYKAIDTIALSELLKILISVQIDLDIQLYKNFDENIEIILSKLIDFCDVGENSINDLNRLIDNDNLLAKTIIGRYSSNLNNVNETTNIKLFRYVEYFKSPSNLGYVIKNHLSTFNEGELNSRDMKYWELIFIGYYCFLKDCCHNQLSDFNEIIRTNIDEKIFFNNVFKLFHICEDEMRVKEIFYCINKIILKSKENHTMNEEMVNKTGIDIYARFKSEIEFYNKCSNFKKLGEIYIKLANDYALLIEEKNGLSILKGKNNQITKKEQDLTIFNLYIRAAELFLKDNCILNYSKVFQDINKLLKENFKDDIEVKLE